LKSRITKKLKKRIVAGASKKSIYSQLGMANLPQSTVDKSKRETREKLSEGTRMALSGSHQLWQVCHSWLKLEKQEKNFQKEPEGVASLPNALKTIPKNPTTFDKKEAFIYI
jgi:hypothetical protein